MQNPAEHDARKLLASEARFQRLLESNIIGIGVTHASGQVLQANDEYLRVLGHTREELATGQVWWSRLTPPEYLPMDRHAIAQADHRGACTPYEKEYRRHDDGALVPVQIAFTTLLDQPEHYIAYVIDLTARKLVEEELRLANKRKDEFLATLSHELRNPLAPMTHALYILRKACPAGEEGPAGRSLLIIERQVRHLTRLVDDLLDMARITNGKVDLRLQAVELQPIVRSALEATRLLMGRRGHRVELDLPQEPLRLEADEVRVEQMLTNLLSNAAKYTEEGGRVRVQVFRVGHDAVVRVLDSGIGIEPHLLSLVFEPFAQADTTRAYSEGGLGIGLALVRRFAEMHGGSVRAFSAGRGTGSEFTLTLPLLRDAAAA